MEVGEREIIYLSLRCRPQNDFCIKVGSGESHFKLMFHNCEGQSHETVSTARPQLLKRKESRSRFEPKSRCLPA